MVAFCFQDKLRRFKLLHLKDILEHVLQVTNLITSRYRNYCIIDVKSDVDEIDIGTLDTDALVRSATLYPLPRNAQLMVLFQALAACFWH